MVRARLATHECPARGCSRQIPFSMLACKPHWYMIPSAERAAVWAAWGNGAGAGTPEHNRAVAAAVDALNARLDAGRAGFAAEMRGQAGIPDRGQPR